MIYFLISLVIFTLANYPLAQHVAPVILSSPRVASAVKRRLGLSSRDAIVAYGPYLSVALSSLSYPLIVAGEQIVSVSYYALALLFCLYVGLLLFQPSQPIVLDYMARWVPSLVVPSRLLIEQADQFPVEPVILFAKPGPVGQEQK